MEDAKTLIAGAAAWACAVPVVRFAGPLIARGGGPRLAALALCGAIALSTTPVVSYILGWRSRAERMRGIALALGAAQAIDGLVHVFVPRFYGADADASLGACSSIFLTAGLTGLASAYT